MADIFSNIRLHDRFIELLENSEPQDRMYVYRMENGLVIKPAILKGIPYPTLLEYLRDKYGTGKYKIFIRRSDVMLLSGTFGILVPNNWRLQ